MDDTGITGDTDSTDGVNAGSAVGSVGFSRDFETTTMRARGGSVGVTIGGESEGIGWIASADPEGFKMTIGVGTADGSIDCGTDAIGGCDGTD